MKVVAKLKKSEAALFSVTITTFELINQNCNFPQFSIMLTLLFWTKNRFLIWNEINLPLLMTKLYPWKYQLFMLCRSQSLWHYGQFWLFLSKNFCMNFEPSSQKIFFNFEYSSYNIWYFKHYEFQTFEINVKLLPMHIATFIFKLFKLVKLKRQKERVHKSQNIWPFKSQNEVLRDGFETQRTPWIFETKIVNFGLSKLCFLKS